MVHFHFSSFCMPDLTRFEAPIVSFVEPLRRLPKLRTMDVPISSREGYRALPCIPELCFQLVENLYTAAYEPARPPSFRRQSENTVFGSSVRLDRWGNLNLVTRESTELKKH